MHLFRRAVGGWDLTILFTTQLCQSLPDLQSPDAQPVPTNNIRFEDVGEEHSFYQTPHRIRSASNSHHHRLLRCFQTRLASTLTLLGDGIAGNSTTTDQACANYPSQDEGYDKYPSAHERCPHFKGHVIDTTARLSQLM
jgi:hypothetical protein